MAQEQDMTLKVHLEFDDADSFRRMVSYIAQGETLRVLRDLRDDFNASGDLVAGSKIDRAMRRLSDRMEANHG